MVGFPSGFFVQTQKKMKTKFGYDVSWYSNCRAQITQLYDFDSHKKARQVLLTTPTYNVPVEE